MCEREHGTSEPYLDEEEREHELRDGRHDRLRRKHSEIHDSNNEIGKITSGCFSPNLNKSIAIGYIISEFNTDNPIFCEIRKKLELVKINNLPFVKKNYKKNGIIYE